MKARKVVLVDAVRTAFGKAGEKGIFWNTRADDMVVKVIRELLRRNPLVKPEMIEENAWGVFCQEKDQGLTLGRTSVILAGLPETTAGFSIDRMCAGGMSAITAAAGEIALGACDVAIAGGVEHMGHHPMGATADPNPRFLTDKLVDTQRHVDGGNSGKPARYVSGNNQGDGGRILSSLPGKGRTSRQIGQDRGDDSSHDRIHQERLGRGG